MTGARARRAAPRRRGAAPGVRSGGRPDAGNRPDSASRPGQRRPARWRDRNAAGTALRRPLFTGRAILLGALLLMLALTLTGPVRQFVAGQQELDELAAQGVALDERAAELQAQLDSQSDPAVIARQARERLTYVLPGDRLVLVDGETVDGPGGADGPAPTPTDQTIPWYEALLGSMAAADGEPTPDSDR